ncbi:MAG: hypothetical protein QOH47_2368 [Sphingomonadales bacterium]|jgi:hypothetical protein|nr:hypothetical protein [Sphingomonadales bacterium]
MPDPVNLDALRGLLAKAPALPWKVNESHEVYSYDAAKNQTQWFSSLSDDDANALAVAAVNALPSLISEIERLREKQNPCAKIFDHKWLSPECVETGCRSLILEHALAAYLKAQCRMLERWSEGGKAVQQELWRNLHACEAAARNALHPEPETR